MAKPRRVLLFASHLQIVLGQEMKQTTVFPHIRPAGIIFLQGFQLRVLLERGYYWRAGIVIRNS